MRVAYLINQYPKVSHTFIRREILALQATGIDVVRIALRGWDEKSNDATDLQEQLQTTYVLKENAFKLLFALLRLMLISPLKFYSAARDTVTLGRKGDRPFWVYFIYLCEACWIKQYLDSLVAGGTKVDHLHAHFGTNPAAVALLLRTLGGPEFSFTVHGPEEFDKPLSLKLGFKGSRAKNVIAISSFGRSQLYRWLDFKDWEKIRIVRCGLEPSYFESTNELSVRMAQQLPNRKLLCIGRLSEQKGHLILIEAATLLHKRGVEFSLVFAGDGELRGVIEQRVKAEGLASKVHITGWISSEQVKVEILSSRGLIVPSFAEGLPVVIMEAMALEKPVISTYVAGIPELVSERETGWLVAAGDSLALASAMQKLLFESDANLTKMGSIGKARVQSAHSITRTSTDLVTIFFEAPVVVSLDAGQ
jgi:colanic acid/amylovoran biosynthesis glycosyltransferase